MARRPRRSFESDNDDELEEDERRPIIVRHYRPSYLGMIRTVDNIRCMEWYFILFSFSLIAIGFCFTILRIVALADLGSDQFLFAILVVINLAFAAYYLVHGILQEQPFEIFTYVVTTLIIAILVTINFTSAETEDYMIRVIRFIITIFLSIPNMAMAVKIAISYWDSGLFIFKTVGGDKRLQRMCRVYLFARSLLLFDSQAMLSCVILLMRSGFSGMTPEQIYLLVTGIVFTALWLFVGHMGMRYENVPITWIFAVISIVQPLYVLYLFVEGLDQIQQENSIRTNSAYFAGFTLLCAHFTLVAILPMVGGNYKKGLKEAIYGDDPPLTPGSNPGNNPAFRQNIVIIPHSHLNYDAILPADDDDAQ